MKAKIAEIFKSIQGEYHRENEAGTPLFFTTNFIGKTGDLIITENGKVVPDMSAFDQAASLSAQYGGNFGQELAQAAAQALLGGSSTPVAAPVSQKSEAEGMDKM